MEGEEEAEEQDDNSVWSEALQDYVTNYHKVRRLHLSLTCGGHGSTIRPGQLHYGAVDLLMGMLWMALNVHVTWCGLKEMGNLILC